MINCGFVNASSFKIKTSNKAKLLYFYLISNADDKGFVDNVDEIIELLDSNDRRFDNDSTPLLLENNYSIALKELIDKGMLILFADNHDNYIYLIRHWYLHNQIPKDRIRNSAYERFLEGFVINKDGEYVKQASYNCDTTADTNEIKLKETKRNKTNNMSNKNDKSFEESVSEEPENKNESLDNSDWNDNLEETIRIAKTPWLDEDD